MKKLKRKLSLIMSLLLAATIPGIPAMASLSDTGASVDGSDIPDSLAGKISYSDTYDPIRWIRPGTDGRNGSGNDPWRNGLVTGNGQNGLIDTPTVLTIRERPTSAKRRERISAL